MKHIELNYPSLAECYSKALELITTSDLGHSARIVIDIDLDSPFDRSFIKIPGVTKITK